jgi:hypothetical protein
MFTAGMRKNTKLVTLSVVLVCCHNLSAYNPGLKLHSNRIIFIFIFIFPSLFFFFFFFLRFLGFWREGAFFLFFFFLMGMMMMMMMMMVLMMNE